MPKLEKLPVKWPVYGAVALVVLVVFAATARLGVFDVSTVAVAFFVFLSGFLGVVLVRLFRKLDQRERNMRQLRFIADRLQAMVKVLPGGYCLFSPQGLLREENGVASRLALSKLTHFDDLVAGVKDSLELIAAFRSFQQTGEGFDVLVRAVANDAVFHVTGQRFRIGRDGPHVDLLWFADTVKTPKAQKEAALAMAVASLASPAPLSSTLSSPQAPAQPDRLQQSLLDVLPFPVWARSKELNLVMCNKAYAKAMDASAEDVLEKQHELMSQTARGGSGRALAANALSINEKQVERRHVIITGKRRLLEITEMPFATATGNGGPGADAARQDTSHEGPAKEHDDKALALIGFAFDVTAEEEKDGELQRHLAAHHEVMEHLGSAVAIYGRDMRLEFFNRSYQKLWESDESFLNAKPTFAEVMEDLRARRRIPEQVDFQRYKKERLALFTSLLEPQEDQMFLPDGTTLRILAVPHPFGGIMFVHENVTDKLALETSYNTLMAVQRETLDNLAEGIAVFGADGKLRLSNPAFADIWKLDAGFLESEPHIAELLENMKPFFNYGTNWTEFKSEMVGYALDRNPRKRRLERADETVVEYMTVPLPDGSVLNSYVDVSDSVRVEQALRASNAALAAADRLKSDFVANVSYQLRTPLNTIAGFADILQEQYFGTLNDKQLEYTHTIKAETQKLTKLINDVLDLATIEAGRLALNRKPVAVSDLLNETKSLTAEWARQQKLEMMIDCPSDIGSFDVDSSRMKQVLFNLVTNAIKYTPEGGRITLEGRKKDGWMEISVVDTGIGIPEADRDRVFSKFERANPQARQGGVGLGLSLVKSLVELHGGRIEVESNAGRGTRITCFVPQTSKE